MSITAQSKMSDNSRDYSLENFVPSFAAINDEVNRISNTLEAHFVSVASSINEALRTTPWLPDSIKPPRRPLRHATVPATPASVGYLECSQDWISRHRALTAAIVAFVGTGAFVIIWQRRRRSRSGKRRARRAKNGARTEVVVLAGSPYSPLTRSLSLDLERRGFIVYIPVNDLSEEHLVQSESRGDIRPLNLDITSVFYILPFSGSNANNIDDSQRQQQIRSKNLQRSSHAPTDPSPMPPHITYTSPHSFSSPPHRRLQDPSLSFTPSHGPTPSPHNS